MSMKFSSKRLRKLLRDEPINYLTSSPNYGQPASPQAAQAIRRNRIPLEAFVDAGKAIVELVEKEAQGRPEATNFLVMLSKGLNLLMAERGYRVQSLPLPYAAERRTKQDALFHAARNIVMLITQPDVPNWSLEACIWERVVRLRIRRPKSKFCKANWLQWEPSFRSVVARIVDEYEEGRPGFREIPEICKILSRHKTKGRARMALINEIVQRARGLAPR